MQSSLAASSLLAQSSRVVDSDSDGEFPRSVESDGSDASGDDSSVDSDEFYDAISKKPVVKVKMGESRRSAMGSSLMGSSMAKSSFG
jgi:hypothetical protein